MSALARELGVLRKDLYKWRTSFRSRGPEGLRARGRPRKAPVLEAPETMAAPAAPDALAKAKQRIAALERKIGQQQVDLDFFRQALRQVGGSAGRATGLARRHLRPSPGVDDTAAARRALG